MQYRDYLDRFTWNDSFKESHMHSTEYIQDAFSSNIFSMLVHFQGVVLAQTTRCVFACSNLR